MKLAISGKGGVGKTTLTALLARAFSKMNKKVLVVDADPDPNLATALGFKNIKSITPIADMKELIEERTGAKPGGFGGFFKMNPKVDDIPEEMSVEKDGIRLLVLGTVQAGAGCICPESVLLKNLVTYLVLERDEVVILDMEAGVEHLGRATAGAVNRLIIVVEPGKRAIETLERVKELATGIGIKNLAVVGNKVRGENDKKFILENSRDIPVIGLLPFSEGMVDADREGLPASEGDPILLKEAEKIAQLLLESR